MPTPSISLGQHVQPQRAAQPINARKKEEERGDAGDQERAHVRVEAEDDPAQRIKGVQCHQYGHPQRHGERITDIGRSEM